MCSKLVPKRRAAKMTSYAQNDPQPRKKFPTAIFTLSRGGGARPNGFPTFTGLDTRQIGFCFGCYFWGVDA